MWIVFEVSWCDGRKDADMDGFPGGAGGVEALDHARELDAFPQQPTYRAVTQARYIAEFVVAVENPDGESIVRVFRLGAELQGVPGLEQLMHVRALMVLVAGDWKIVRQHIASGGGVAAEERCGRNEWERGKGGEEVSPGIVCNFNIHVRPF